MATPGPEPREVTRLLNQWGDGSAEALDALVPILYDELRRLARGYLGRERADHTLQPTGLVHEAYIRLVDQRSVRWQNRQHFFGVAAELMRRVLVDHARRKHAAKRGGGQALVEFEERKGAPATPREIVALDDALTSLGALDPRAARLVELRYFAGLSNDEAASVLKISPATAKRDWRAAKAWLKREIARTPLR